jgi:ANTAR domain-containing protein/GAF domain-containing protein
VTSTAVEELAETLVELADTVSAELDLDGFMRVLVNRCARVFDVPAVGVFILDHGVAASRESLTPALRHEETPLVDACRAAEPVVVPDLTGSPWPAFVADVTREGFTSVHVVPLCRRAETIGSLALFRETGGAAGGGGVARAVADVAAVVVSQARALHRAEELGRQLQHALDSRVVIEQAKGVLSERLGVDMGAAFSALRRYARSHNSRVSELASSIVDGGFDTDLLLG